MGGLPKIPYKGVEQKRGEGKQRFKKGDKLGQGGGGAGTPLRTVDTGILHIVFCSGY